MEDSAVPTGLVPKAPDSPGTEVPGYSLCVPMGRLFARQKGRLFHRLTIVDLMVVPDRAGATPARVIWKML